MPKVSLDMPAEILHDIRSHVGDDRKFVSVVGTATHGLLDNDTVIINASSGLSTTVTVKFNKANRKNYKL